MTDKTAEQTPALGIDIGGSGIKGAPVDLHAGEMMTDRLRIRPRPSPHRRMLRLWSVRSSTTSRTR